MKAGLRGRTDDEVCMNDDKLLDYEIVNIDSGPNNNGLSELLKSKAV